MNDSQDRLARRLRADADRLRAAHPAPALAARVRARLEERHPPTRRRWPYAAAAAVLLGAGLLLARGLRQDPQLERAADLAPLPELSSLVAASTDLAREVIDAPVLSEYEALAADAGAAMSGLFAHVTARVDGLASAR